MKVVDARKNGTREGDTRDFVARLVLSRILESLSNDDGDANENGKKAIGLDWQNNDSARASRFCKFSYRQCTSTT